MVVLRKLILIMELLGHPQWLTQVLLTIALMALVWCINELCSYLIAIKMLSYQLTEIIMAQF